MTRKIKALIWVVLIVSALVDMARAAEEPFTQKFLGSPLLILAVLIVADAIALAFHRLRK